MSVSMIMVAVPIYVLILLEVISVNAMMDIKLMVIITASVCSN